MALSSFNDAAECHLNNKNLLHFFVIIAKYSFFLNDNCSKKSAKNHNFNCRNKTCFE